MKKDDFLAFVRHLVKALPLAALPWLLFLFKLRIVSDYYQPQLNAGASGLAVLGFLASWAICARMNNWKKGCVAIVAWILGAVCGSVCLWFTFTVGRTWAPSEEEDALIQWWWQVLYLGLFFFLSVGLCAFLLMIPRKRGTAEKTPAEGQQKKGKSQGRPPRGK